MAEGGPGDNGETIIAAAREGHNSSCPKSAALAGRRGELQRISHPPTFGSTSVGFRQLLVYHLFAIIVHSGRGQLTSDPLLLCPSESLLGQTVGKWQGCITSKINVGKYGSDARSFTSRLLNSHSLLLRPAWGRKGGEGEGKPRD